jgi:hypothetical protein
VDGLVAEGALVEEVADDAEGEDGGGEEVAGGLGFAAEQAGENLVVVFWEAREGSLEDCQRTDAGRALR